MPIEMPKTHVAKTEHRYVVANYEFLQRDQLPIRLVLSSSDGDINVFVSNRSNKSIFLNRNLLLQSMVGVPLVFLVVRNNKGQFLYVCGHFEDFPDEHENVEIKPGRELSFPVSALELKRRYCVDEALVSVHVVDPIGRNFYSFAKSNELVIR